eukprot:6330863-Alexandrium_andersonii.AAC.1
MVGRSSTPTRISPKQGGDPSPQAHRIAHLQVLGDVLKCMQALECEEAVNAISATIEAIKAQ